MQDHVLLEELAHFDRERIPKREKRTYIGRFFSLCFEGESAEEDKKRLKSTLAISAYRFSLNLISTIIIILLLLLVALTFFGQLQVSHTVRRLQGLYAKNAHI